MKAHVQSESNLVEAQRRRVKFITAVFYGAFVGVLVGILAMALGVIIVSLLGLFMDTAVLRLPGISMAAMTFVTFFFLGSLAAISLIWRRLQ